MKIASSKIYHLFFLSLLIAWFCVYFSTLKSMVSVWQGSETYTYCFLILPIVIYLIYEKKQTLFTIPLKNCFWFLFPLFIGQFGFLLADLASLGVVTHLAAYGSLVCIVGLVYGWQIFKFLIFPLAFLIFAVPMGEELVPFLQKVTADISVFFVRLVGIPVYREGLYIYIPNGTFVVAEACSGIRFLISMISIAALYAYLFYVSFWRRTAFIVFSIILSIVANGIRAFGIIYIGHVSNMTHAVGFDHLVYGWFFFAFVLILLLFFGNFWRENNSNKYAESSGINLTKSIKVPSYLLLMFTFLLLSLKPLYQSFVIGKLDSTFNFRPYVNQLATLSESEPRNIASFEPHFPFADNQFTVILAGKNVNTEIFVAQFQTDSQQQELISSVNRLYNIEKFSLIDSHKLTLTILDTQVPASVVSLVAVSGLKKTLIYWYEAEGVISSSSLDIKKAQLFTKLKGGVGAGMITIINIDGDRQNLKELKHIVETLDIFSK
ncbi:exosortase A [Flavobacterium sp. W21_SRS_FM6]|uniref:exosortase A n=1 Tax=Flavobacterium sp. W21_SRS_FM6 TaxID=3240268 RepID=UPI003F91BC82